MLHCANTSGNLAVAGDMTVLERQRARMKWQEEQGYFSGNSFNGVFSSSSLHVPDSIMVAADSGCALAEVVAQAQPRSINKPSAAPGLHANSSSISRTFSCPPALVEPESESKPKPKPTDSSVGKDGFKKRKPDKPHHPKVCVCVRAILNREKKRTCCVSLLELAKLTHVNFLFRLLQKMITKTRGSNSALMMENPKSPRVTQQTQIPTTTKKLAQRLQIPRPPKSLITFMSEHVVAKPPIVIA